MSNPAITEQYRAVRDRLVELSHDYDQARKEFTWPQFENFNFALDWFDSIARSEERADQPGLILANAEGIQVQLTFSELADRSDRVAAWFTSLGVQRGDTMIMMLDNEVGLWDAMLGAMKIGAVILPTTTMLAPHALASRVNRTDVSWILTNPENLHKITEMHESGQVTIPAGFPQVMVTREPAAADVDAAPFEINHFDEAYSITEPFVPSGETKAEDPLLIYFTSGTTSEPKMVLHTHYSYSIGHLSTMYWMGLRPGDVHLNIASPGWGKHAWSNFFTPWIAEATVLVYLYDRFDAEGMMATMNSTGVTSVCFPPTVWRMLIQADLSQVTTPPRGALSAGEPLNASIIEYVMEHWGIQIRDGYGQTESTLQIANTPGQPVKPGALGRALPGYEVVLLDEDTEEVLPEGPGAGQVALRLDPRPAGLTPGYYRDDERNAEAFRDGLYRTGDVMSRDADGVYTYVGRADDLFKASDYKLSPFELESGIIKHPAVAEVAVVPSPDAIRTAVPKAYIVLRAGYEPNEDTARDIFAFAREVLPPYGRIRRLQFSELPKTVSGKIRRVELRRSEIESHGALGEKTEDFRTTQQKESGYDIEFYDAQFRKR